MGDFIVPVAGPQSFELKPRENRQFVFEYGRSVRDQDTGEFHLPEVADPNIRVSFFVIDEQQSGGSWQDRMPRGFWTRELCQEWNEAHPDGTQFTNPDSMKGRLHKIRRKSRPDGMGEPKPWEQ